MIEVVEFEFDFACFEVNIVVLLDYFFRVEHGVKGFEIGVAFWVGGLSAVLPQLQGAGIVEGGF
jgi:hypothetical protein